MNDYDLCLVVGFISGVFASETPRIVKFFEKGIKRLCHKKTLLLCLSVLPCSLFFLSSSASALEFQDGIAFNITGASGTANTGTVNFVHTNNDWAGYFTGNTLTGLNFNFEPWQSSATIPDQYLITFNVTYTSTLGNNVTTGGHYRYNGLQSSNMQLVFESCIDRTNGAVFNGGVVQYIGEGIAQCTYIFYSAADYNYFNSISNSRIFYGESSTDSQVIITPGFIRAISWNGLTQDDRDWLESVMPAGTSVSQIEQGVENALNTQSETEREELQDAQDDAENDSDDSQTAVQGATTSLLAVLGQFITAVTSANATNCNLNGDLIPHVPLGTLNLCSNSPPPAITSLGSLILIAFIIPLAYNTVKMIINLIGEFQR